jgi:chromosome segregation ATPase
MTALRKTTEDRLHSAQSKLEEMEQEVELAQAQSSKERQQPSDVQLSEEKTRQNNLARALEQSERRVAALEAEKAQLAEALKKVKAQAEILEQTAKEDHKMLQRQRKRIDTAELKRKALLEKLEEVQASQGDSDELVDAFSRAEKAEESLEKTTKEMAKINKEMAIVKDRLVGEISLRKRAEEQLETLAPTSDVFSVSNRVQQILERVREELIAEQKKVRELKAQLEQSPKANAAGDQEYEELLRQLEAMKGELSQEQIKVRDLRSRLQKERQTESVPDREEAEQELEQTRQALQAEKEKVAALRKELSAASQQGASSSSEKGGNGPISVMEALEVDPSFNPGQRETIRIIVNRFLGKKR